MNELEIKIHINGKKMVLNLGAMDYSSLYELSAKLRLLLSDMEFTIMSLLVADLEFMEEKLPKRSINAIRRYGITTVADLLASSRNELMFIEGLGRKSLSEIEEFVKMIEEKVPQGEN